MAFSSTITQSIPGGLGSRQIVYGTFTNAVADTGGTISTGLNVVESVILTGFATGSHYVSAVSGGAVTIVTAADLDGYWTAFGY